MTDQLMVHAPAGTWRMSMRRSWLVIVLSCAACGGNGAAPDLGVDLGVDGSAPDLAAGAGPDLALCAGTPASCGAPGACVACPTPPNTDVTCVSNTCGATCVQGTTQCGGSCVDPMTSDTDCGHCAHSC